MKKALKYIGILLGVFVLGLLYFLLIHQSDLRTELVKKDPQPIEGRALMMKMGEAHNISAWDSINTYTVIFQDEFFGTMGANSHPYPTAQMEAVLDYIPNTYNGRISFTDGSAWGIQAWKTYIRQPGGAPVFTEHKDAYFWIPTYQYFLELPMRIQTATVVSYAGTKEIRGKKCKGIFASWGKYKPQKDIDQYLIWIDETSSQIQQVQYTIRDMFGFMTGTCNYLDYMTFNNIPLPTKMPVNNLFGMDGLLHQMGINGMNINMIPKSDLLPNKDLEYVGDAKEGQSG